MKQKKSGSRKTPIVLCADDFGISKSTSKGIIELLKMDRLTAVSCMSVFSDMDVYDELNDFRSADVGLHFTMTDFEPLSTDAKRHFGSKFPKYLHLLSACYKGAIPASVIEHELNTQYQKLTGLLGKEPDFIDGHHHIHQFPQIADVVSRFCSELKKTGKKIFVRTTSDNRLSIFMRRVARTKSYALDGFGRYLQIRLNKYDIASNSSFSGAYSLSENEDYPKLFKQMIKYHTFNGLIMCHPGLVDETLKERDIMVNQRKVEWDYLISSQFKIDIQNAGVELGRFNHN